MSFLLCTIPPDFEISKRRLVTFWVAEGFVKQSGDHQLPPKYVAEKEYLPELIRRNLIQVVEGTLNRNFETCVFPPTLQNLWLQQYVDHVLYYYDGSSSHGYGHKHGAGRGSINSPNL
ncbi:putative disease resistance protein At1g59780 [Fagus crenata]